MRNRNVQPRSARLTLAVGVLAALTLSACVVAPAPVMSDPYGYPGTGTVYAPVAPPAPYYEAQPAPPYPGAT